MMCKPSVYVVADNLATYLDNGTNRKIEPAAGMF
jgi:hypothetical protein